MPDLLDEVTLDNPIKQVFAKTKINAITDKVGSAKGINHLSEIAQLAAAHMVDMLEVLSPPPIAMQIKSNGEMMTLFTKGNFSIVTGFAKSRKSFLISMLLAAATAIEELLQIFRCPTSGMNILFDTEQSKYKVQQIIKRICKLCGNLSPKNFACYSLRTLSPAERLTLIDYVLGTTPNINFVAIDGIIDLDIDPILQADQAQNIVMHLMKWTEIYNIHIVCVLHYNKTVKNLLGHLGSFSHRKADAIIEVSKDAANSNISIVTPIDCREKEFEPFAFSINDDGLPYILDDYQVKPSTIKDIKSRPKAITYNDFTEKQHSEIISEVFRFQKELTYTRLWQSIKEIGGKIIYGKIGDNNAKDFTSFYVESGFIEKPIASNGHGVYKPKKKTQVNQGEFDEGFDELT